MGRATELSEFEKAGVVVTDTNSEARVVFRTPLPNDLQYVVILTSGEFINATTNIGGFATELTQTGFKINSVNLWTGNNRDNAIIYWVIKPVYND
jgi:hypothetical protein